MIARGSPEIERRGRIAFDVDAAGDVIAGFEAALVVLEQRVVERYENGLRGERRQVEDFDVQLAVSALTVHGDVDGNHVRLDAEHAANGRVAIFGECADGIAGVDDLECIERRGQGVDDFGGGHGQRDGAGLEDRVTAGEKLFGIDVGDGAGGRDFKIAADQLGADGGTGHDAGDGGGRDGVEGAVGVRLRGAAAASGGDDVEAGAGHFLLPEANGFRPEAAHDERRFHGLKGHAAGGEGLVGLRDRRHAAMPRPIGC